MPNVQTLRPSATTFAGGWTPSTGTLHGVTSDNNDATYAGWTTGADQMTLSVGSDTLPVGHRRHRARVRVRGEDGNIITAVRRPNGTLGSYSSLQLPSSVGAVDGSWGTGLPETQAGAFGVMVDSNGLPNVRVAELFVDIDSRDTPTHDVELLDASGSPETTLTDTNTPTVRIFDTDYDDLPARQWRAWITSGVDIVWDSGIVAGSPVATQVEPLENGSYTLHSQVWSTLGADTAFPSADETLAFTVNVAAVAPPATVTVEELDGMPFYQITVCAPSDMSDYDDSVAYVQVQRVDCEGVTTVYLSEVQVSASLCTGYIDWAAPRALPGDCDEDASPCPITWRARFVGAVSGARVTSEWVEADTTYLYRWDSAGDEEGWVGEGTTTVTQSTTERHDGPGSLQTTETMTSGFSELRFNDASGPRDLSANGPVLRAWVLVPEDAPGTGWQARLELQDVAFTWVPGPNYDVTPGTWLEVEYQPDPALLAACRSIGFAIGATGVDQAQEVYVDTLRQGQPQRELTWTAGEHLLRSNTEDGPIFASACGELDWGVDRPFTVAMGIMGSRQVTSGASGGRDFGISLSVENEEQRENVEELLVSPLVLVSPADSPAAWASPGSTGVQLVKVGRVRRVTAGMVGTGPEPEPLVSDREV